MEPRDWFWMFFALFVVLMAFTPIFSRSGRAAARKPVASVSDETLMMADLARKALVQVRGTVLTILTIGGVDGARAEALAETLATGTVTHDYPISFERAKALGLPVSDDFPDEVHELMSHYATPTNRRPSVMYVPLPMAEDGAPARGQPGPPQ